MWAIAQYDFGLTLEEFGKLTPAMFMALMERRNVEFKHACFNAGITASAVYNSTRRDDKQKVFMPFDFVPSSEQELGEREKLRHNITTMFAFLTVSANPSAEYMNDLRQRTIERLTEQGYEGVEEMFDECFDAWSRRLKN